MYKVIIVEIKLDELILYENNPRNNEEAIESVANSIKTFGFKVPIVVDRNNVIIAGHTRYKAAKKLGLNKVPCIVADDLTEDQVNAFHLADNKVGKTMGRVKDLIVNVMPSKIENYTLEYFCNYTYVIVFDKQLFVLYN